MYIYCDRNIIFYHLTANSKNFSLKNDPRMIATFFWTEDEDETRTTTINIIR